MLSSDHNIENIVQLLTELKHYAELKGQYLQTDFICKMTRLMTALIIGAVLFMLGAVALMFISMTLAAFLAPHVGGEAASYAIIVLLYVLIALLVYSKRHSWVEAPIANFLGHLFLDKPAAGQTNNEESNDEDIL